MAELLIDGVIFLGHLRLERLNLNYFANQLLISYFQSVNLYICIFKKCLKGFVLVEQISDFFILVLNGAYSTGDVTLMLLIELC